MEYREIDFCCGWTIERAVRNYTKEQRMAINIVVNSMEIN